MLASQSIVSLKQDTNLSVGLSQLYVEIAEAIAHFTDAEIPNQHMPRGKMHQILSFHKIRSYTPMFINQKICREKGGHHVGNYD